MPIASAAAVAPAGSSPPRPLSFAAWFARRSYWTDIVLLLLEILTLFPAYTSQLMFRALCVPTGGGLHSALQAELPLLDPAARRVDAVLAGFPCAAPYPRQLLYTLRTGAAVDPGLRLRLADYSNMFLVVAELLTLGLALASRPLYERLRSWLLSAVLLAPAVGAIAATVYAATGLLALGAAGHYGNALQRLAVAAYFAWKLLVVLRLVSAVCVPGCVHLLLTLRWGAPGGGVISVGTSGEDHGGGGDGVSARGGSGEGERGLNGPRRITLCHMSLGTGGGGGSTAGGGGERSRGGQMGIGVVEGALQQALEATTAGGAADTATACGVETPIDEAVPAVAQQPASSHAAEPPPQQWPEDSTATAPLASLPLMVLPPVAAQETRRLHEEVLGAEAVACLDGLLSQHTGEGQDRQALLAAAAADVVTSGLHDVAYDLGSLLSMHSHGTSAPAGTEEHTEDMPVTDPRVFDGLLRLLASHGMDACLGEAQRALEAACGGVRPAAGLEAAVSGGGSADGFAGATDVTSAVGSTEATFDRQCPVAGRRVLFLANTAARDSGALGQDGPDSGYQAATSLMGRYGSAPFSLEPAGQPRPGPAWWLRAMLRGFQPPALEAAYQVFKAAQLVGLDRTSFVLNAGMRAASMHRTYATRSNALVSSAAAAAVMPAEPAAEPAPWILQMTSQVLLLTAILLVLALSVLTQLHSA
ncbi:hypothetical protein GPECTOR_13g790 [Gonium pectorale]|uniref:Uncharacterized protein n=1 Tax=Gonium pectorale TaxID=33097 RepID=A0A150GN86_GONPE|nr:hypothetical protein GPECTOR_13g790 [Gonium pectorale]|eukprot:KXZ51303.1 hypothetical protein GPECTOR_13g790 [Gonium pectorale]